MKKKYSTPNLIKVVSLSTVMATLLSSVSPVVASNLAITGDKTMSTNGSGVSYDHGSHGSIVFAGDDNYCGVDNVIGRGGKQQESIASTNQITAEQQYDRFIKNTNFSGRYPYGVTTDKVTWSGDSNTSNSSTGYMGKLTGGSTSAMPEAYGVYSFATGCGSAATGNYSTAFGAGATAKSGGAQAFGVSALANGAASVAIGIGSETVKRSSIAIGGLSKADGIDSIAFGSSAATGGQDAIAIGYAAKAGAQNAVSVGSSTKATGKSSLALGYKASASGELAVAIGGLATGIHGIAMGNNAEAKDQDTIAIGYAAQAQTKYSIAIGPNAQVIAGDGVALGGASVASVVNNVAGYDPVSNKNSQQNNGAWKSTKSAISVGKADGSITRQITGLAAGTADTDAVNVAQLKAMRAVVEGAGGWKLSVNGEAAVDILPGETVNFAGAELENYENKNIKIVRKDDKTVEFDLNDFITVGRVQAGKTQLSDLGFVITGGPRMTGSGIFAGNKQVYGVAAGSAETDAVNVAQLNDVKELISKAGGSWKLSVDGNNATDVGAGSTVDIVAAVSGDGSKNIKIEKDNNKVTFSLNDTLKLTSVTTGNSIMNSEGFIIENGPRMILDGISAGNKKITDVAAGKSDTDAVNYAQLSEVRQLVSKAGGWKLSVNGEAAVDILPGETVNFAGAELENYENKNIKIVRKDDKTVEFDLNDFITVGRVQAGKTQLSDLGFVITGGPRMTGSGIFAGNKQVYGVAAGSAETDAVNVAQLNEVKNQIAGNGLVKWDEEQKLITIGKEKDGTKIDVAGSGGDRSISGVKAAERDNEAVNKKQLDGEIATITDTINNIKEGGAFAVLYDKNGDSSVNYNSVTLGGGKTGGQVALHNVKDGEITEESYDAINGRQLWKTNERVTDVEKDIVHINDKVTNISATVTDLGKEVFNIQEANAFAVLYDKNADETVNYNSVTLGGGKSTGPVALLNVKDGKIAKDSHDAINGNQINTISGDIAKFFGEGTVFQDGSFLGPRYNLSTVSADGTVGQKVHTDVGSALTGLDDNVNNVNSRLTHVANEFTQKIEGVSKDSLLWSNDEQAFVAQHGDGKTNSKIKFLSNGDITENSTDAVNGSQLFATNQNVNTVTNNLTTIAKNISKYFGGGASFENGAFKGPHYSLSVIVEDGQVAKANYHDVGSALSGLDANVKSVNMHLTNVVKDVNEKITNITQEVKGDALLWSNDEQAFVALHGEGQKTNSKLTSLLNGDISEDSTDAVNGSQLYETNQKISKLGNGFDGISTNISKYFGGDTDIANGKAPTYTIQGTTHNDVSSAFSSVNNSITEISNQISNATKNSLVKQEENEGDITIGKEKGGTKIDITGSGGARTIAGVKAAENDNEAVNKKQLDESIGKINNNIENISASAVLYDKNDDSTVNYESVTLGGNKVNGQVALHNVKDGEISDQSHDAINGSQINKISQNVAEFFGGGTSFENGVFRKPRYNLTTIDENGQVKQREYNDVGLALSGLDTNIRHVNHHLVLSMKDVASYFGGGAGYDENGEWYAPTFVVSQRNEDGTIVEKKHHNVADAFKGVDNSITDIYNQINNVTENSLVKQEGGSEGLITVGKATGGTKISIANKDNQERTLSGIKDGELSQTSTEAVNGSQLFATNEKVTTVNNDLKTVAQNTSKYFGGSTDVLNGIEPAFLIQGETYHNVTEAFTGVNTSITNIDNKISEVVKNSLVKQEKNTDVITIGKDTAGTEINIAGYAGVARSISGVKAAEKGDEAVNKDQLDKSIKDITKDIETVTAAAVLYDKNDDNSVNYGSVTLGGDKNNGPVALHNVKDGSISENSNDAINGSQINKISADIAKFFGGGAKFINGAFEGLKYTLSAIVGGEVGKANFYNVGDALTGLDKNVQDVNQRLTNVSNEFNQKIEDFSKDALLWDDEEEAFVARHEKDGKKTNSKLKYLLDGKIAQGSTDAITGNQLYSMNNQLANYFGGGAKYENGKWTDPTFKIVQVNADGTTVETEHHNVADAFGDVNKNMSNINNRIDDVINKVDSDALKWNDKEKTYDAGRDGKPNKIINVADGKVEKGSKDAVNGGQLWETNERVTGVEKDVKHLTNRVDTISNTIADIGDTVINIDAKVDNINNRVDGIEEDAVRYDRDENGKKTNKITLAGGDASEPVLIDNVADGKIEKGSKEAVNGGQLHDYTKEQIKIILDESKQYTDQRVNNIVIDAIDDAVDRAKQYTDMKFDILNYSIESVKKEARQAAAIGLAVSNLRYNDTPGKLSVGFGTGLWRSQSAFAFGAGYTSENGKYRSNISATTSGGHWGVGAGFNMTLN
ncbi:Vomp family autotransporter [Bartonella sp. AA74HLJMH]|uniref:Vomp family autotransporter n=1 Tax=Bartonella sp. AA74HLJMH TaxID=3243436 RepID=UPI0035D0B7D6